MRRRLTRAFASLCLFGLGVGSLPAQTPAPTPDENPEGNTGALKAQVTTGASYDAHSGSATRIVNDLHVPGAPGVYGLDFTRYWNSVPNDYGNPYAALPSSFGASGWSHSWEWHAFEEETSDNVAGDGTEEIYTTAITITFPDGHANRYKITRSNRAHGIPPNVAPPDPRLGPPYTVPEQNGFLTGGMIYDLLRDMAADGSQFWLYLADGGSVHFIGGPSVYQASAVFDPHGLHTDLRYNDRGDLDQVTQEGGRSLTITWGYHAGSVAPVIDRLDTGGSAGSQFVEYHYARFPDPNTGNFLVLSGVRYPGDVAAGQDASASYTYGDYYGEDENSGHSSYPLLKIANDPRYAGAMTRIFYTYNAGACPSSPPPDCNCLHRYFQAVPTSIATEKSADHLDQFGQHVTVSSFGIDCFGGTRTETSGLGGWRLFYFGDSAGGPGTLSIQGYQLAKLTDFTYTNPPPAGLPFEWQNYKDGQPCQIWDGRNIETEAIVTPGDLSGQPGEIHHVTADGSFQIFDRVHPGASDAQDLTLVPNRYNHWLFSHTDECGLITTYRRDSRRRVSDITYPVTAEQFTYNDFNQVLTHTLPSGAVQTYVYDDTTHRLMVEYNSVDGWDARKEYVYDDASHPDLVHKVIDGRARLNGAAYSTRMEYNGRNQILEVHYAPTPGGSSDPHITYGYDSYGNCTSMTDEMGHASSYTYDSYRRCTSYTEPLNALNWNGSAIQSSRRWDWIYDRYIPETGLRDAYTHTKNEWRVQIEPAFNAAGERKMTARWHDLQNRIIRQESGWIQRPTYIGDWYWSGDGEIHDYTYDENGQKKTDTLYIAPQNRLTTYTYDLRNRLKDTIETKLADQSVNPTTTILYDTTSNKTDVTFPDTRSQHWRDYDPFGQAQTFIDERGNTTNLTYVWGPMKKLYTVATHRAKDGGGTEDQLTVFSYDLIGKPTQVLFPDQSHEDSTYEFGQLKTWKTRKNQTKTIVYDARGRELSHSWNDGVTPAISRGWDDANRLSSITNIFSSIDFAYDDAGQVIWEGDEIAGSGGRTQTNYYRYPDGSVAHLHYPGGAYVRHDYTARGQLAATGWDDDDNNWWMKLAAYIYLSDGKVGRVDYGNGVQSAIGYDERGFVQIVDHYNVASRLDYSWRRYWRDSRDRITAFQKNYNPGINPMENGRGDRFHYDDEGQLLEGWYNATDPANSGNNATRYDGFTYDALGNRGQNNYVASRGQMSFTHKDNGLNQYRAWWPYSYTNYDDDIGGTWGAPGAANGVLMQDGWITAGFNALNQPMYITSPTYYGTSNWMYFGYDPLGRGVKRWVGESGDVYSNPATYFHYDGWNLLQEGNNAWGPARVYVHGSRIDEIVWSYNTFTGEQASHHYDARGHCTLLTDSGGNILEQYEYDAFGWPYFYDASGNSVGAYDAVQNLWEGYSQFGNRFLFTGREWLSDLKLYDYRNRLYQPELGRFLQPDPKEFGAGDYNLYRYCHNDPVNRSDPFGLLEADHEDKELAKPILVKDTYRPVTGSNIPIHIRVFNSGNWNDRTVANHATTGLEAQTGKGGLTKPSGSSDVSGSNVDINMHVDWYYDAKYSGTNVVTRELQHVQDARNLERGYWDGSKSASLANLRNFAGIVSGFNTMQILKYDQTAGPHNLLKYPAIPTTVPEYDETH
jgi:RHS repeat-associated protein